MGASGPTTSNQRAVVYPAATSNFWAYSGGILGGGDGTGNPVVAVACWNVSGGNPGSLRGSTATVTFSNTMTSGLSGGTVLTGTFASAIQLYSGTQYALGYLSTAHDFNHGMSAAANFSNGSGGYTQPVVFYFRDVSAQPPTDPMGYTSNSVQGVISVFLNVTANRAPTAALVSPSGTITSATPAMQYSFTDADATAGYGDKLHQYRIQVRRKSDNASFWDATFTATTAEQSAAQTNQTYAGTALVPGTTYQSRAWVSDLFATASAWTAWTDFTVNAGGTVTVVSPSGKQNVSSGITFTADWTHASSLSTQDVQIQLLQNGVVVQDSGSIAKTVVSSSAPGTSFTITWAQSGFSTLTWGTAYTYQIRGQDTGGLWSPYSTPQTAFSTDAYPNVATGLSPANSLAVTSPPILTATITDPDAGDTLTANARIKLPPTIANPTFTSDVSGWTGSNTGDTAGATVTAPVYDTSVYASGGAKTAITASTAVAGIVYHVENTATWIPVVAGESYTVRGAYETSAANLHPLLQIRWYNSGRTLLSTSQETDWAPAVNTSYTRAFTATAPASAVYCRIALALNTAANNTTGNAFCNAFSVDQGTRFIRSMSFAGSTATYQTALGTNDVQTISATGATSGTFTVNVDGAVSATIAWNASAATVQSTLQALWTVGAAMTCTGGPLNTTPIICTYNQALAGTYRNLATIGINSLVGATPTIAHTTSGVPSDLAQYGTYYWDCAGNDGTLTGSYPTQATFIYGQGPTVVVTAPVANSTITTATPTVTWTASGQVKYEIVVYLHNTSTVVYDSGVITSAVQSVAIPSGYLHGSPSTDYDIVVYVTNSTPLTGSNAAQKFTVNYTAPTAPTNFRASPTLANLDAQASSVLCSWDQSVYASNVFVQYILDRRDAGTAASDASTVILGRFTSLTQLSFVDYLPVPDHSYTYSIRQQVTQGTDVTESGRVEAAASVSLAGIVICAALDGGTYRAVLSYTSARKYQHTQDTQTLTPWGAAQPTVLIGAQNYQTLTGTFTLLADSVAQASAYIAALRAMYAQRLIVCVRDERDRRFFGVIRKFDESDVRYLLYTVDLEVVEVTFTEGAV